MNDRGGAGGDVKGGNDELGTHGELPDVKLHEGRRRRRFREWRRPGGRETHRGRRGGEGLWRGGDWGRARARLTTYPVFREAKGKGARFLPIGQFFFCGNILMAEKAMTGCR